MSVEWKTIGRFEIVRVLGHGAMGVVFLAHDPLLKRPLAIKTMREFGEEAQATLLRFQREAEISARLNHPNVVTVHDVGDDPQAGPFLAMEYVDGGSLGDLINAGIPLETAFDLLFQGMRALVAAERAGIIHRDVKPGNFMVSSDGRLKLMDFGIARSDGARLTQTGQFFGTPSFTAPELLLGGEPCPATDHYAFAVTAFQMLTGALPFERSTLGATLYHIVHEPPLFPEAMAAEMRELFAKAFAKAPEARFPDLPSFLEALVRAAPLPPRTRDKLLGLLENEPGPGAQSTLAGVLVAPLAPMAEPAVAGPAQRSTNRDAPTEVFPRPGTDPSLITRPHDPQGAAPGRPAPPRAPARQGFSRPLLAALLLLGLGAAWAWKTHPMAGKTAPAGIQALAAGQPALRAANLPGSMLPAPAPVPAQAPELSRHPGPATAGQSSSQAPVRQPPGPAPLAPAQTFAALHTQPAGAEAFLEGNPIGRTPLAQVAFPRDKAVNLTLKLTGYQDWQGRISPGQQVPELIRLVPLIAHFAVRTEPPGAAIAVDGSMVGQSPMADVPVSRVGQHTIRITREGYQDWSAVLDPRTPLPNPIALVARKETGPPRPVPPPQAPGPSASPDRESVKSSRR